MEKFTLQNESRVLLYSADASFLLNKDAQSQIKRKLQSHESWSIVDFRFAKIPRKLPLSDMCVTTTARF